MLNNEYSNPQNKRLGRVEGVGMTALNLRMEPKGKTLATNAGDIEQTSVILGDEFDDTLRARLIDVLKSIGTIPMCEAENSVAGSQYIETFRVSIEGKTFIVEAETYIGLSIRGPSEIVQRLCELIKIKSRTKEPKRSLSSDNHSKNLELPKKNAAIPAKAGIHRVDARRAAPETDSASRLPSPELVLIHGWGMNCDIWSPCLAAFEGIAKVRLVDLPGYGETPDSGQSFAETAQSLADSLPANAVLCGWSLGVMLAMQAALLCPQNVGGLILVGGTPCFIQRDGWTAAQAPSLLEEFSAAVAKDGKTALQRFVALFNRGDAKARAIGRDIARNVLSASPPSTAALLAGLGWLRDTDLRERIPELACPALLIHGEHDPLMPLSAARWLAEKLPHARLEVFPGAAHAPFLNDPERFARLTGSFLDALRTD
jgi:pimeloyl-[acyl-carrier protein] methyl ester esterase